ncbi:hypothetical protein HRbin09_01528 [bacterium HR09]|nr:hypothetical protein HRbin09_01528 [bacterium HR09]
MTLVPPLPTAKMPAPRPKRLKSMPKMRLPGPSVQKCARAPCGSPRSSKGTVNSTTCPSLTYQAVVSSPITQGVLPLTCRVWPHWASASLKVADSSTEGWYAGDGGATGAAEGGAGGAGAAVGTSSLTVASCSSSASKWKTKTVAPRRKLSPFCSWCSATLLPPTQTPLAEPKSAKSQVPSTSLSSACRRDMALS